MKTESIIRYNFLAQNLNALQGMANSLTHERNVKAIETKKTIDFKKTARIREIDELLPLVNNDVSLISKEVNTLHIELFSDLQDELGHEFKYLIKKPINGQMKKA
jgi:hypothetical protein